MKTCIIRFLKASPTCFYLLVLLQVHQSHTPHKSVDLTSLQIRGDRFFIILTCWFITLFQTETERLSKTVVQIFLLVGPQIPLILTSYSVMSQQLLQEIRFSSEIHIQFRLKFIDED